MSATSAVIEWYRVDQTRHIRRVLTRGAAVLTCGAVVVALSFLTRQGEAVRIAAAAVGLVATLGGALSTVVAMSRALREDAYLAVRADGVALHGSKEPTVIAWVELARVRYDDGAAALVFERRSLPPMVASTPFAGTSLHELAQRLEQLRRRAELGLVLR